MLSFPSSDSIAENVGRGFSAMLLFSSDDSIAEKTGVQSAEKPTLGRLSSVSSSM